jgi:cellulose synthase/poly-beta-1,6-N-acetylglucosamine synthase-like glycosyltransferase
MNRHNDKTKKQCPTPTSGSFSEEVPLNWNKWIRQTHRWLSIAFTVAVIVNGVAVAQGKYTSRLGLSAVFVLALQFLTGLYLFVLPYVSKWGSGRRAE